MNDPRESILGLAHWVYQRLGYREVRRLTPNHYYDFWLLNAEGMVELLQVHPGQSATTATDLAWLIQSMTIQRAVQGHYWNPHGFEDEALKAGQQHYIICNDDGKIKNLVEEARAREPAYNQKQRMIFEQKAREESRKTKIAVGVVLGIVIFVALLVVLYFMFRIAIIVLLARFLAAFQ